MRDTTLKGREQGYLNKTNPPVSGRPKHKVDGEVLPVKRGEKLEAKQGVNYDMNSQIYRNQEREKRGLNNMLSDFDKYSKGFEEENGKFLSGQEKYLNSYRKRMEQPLEMGNIDLLNRPVLKNPDGSISTVESFSINDNGKEVVLPQIGERNGQPYRMSFDEAVNNYYTTGKHLGKFKSVEGANRFADWLHKMQERQYK